MFNGKIHYIWSFSIAMLNYQRVKVFYVCLLFWGMRSSINWGNDGFRMVLHVDLETHYQSLSIWGGFFPCRMGIAYQYDLRGPTNSRTNIIPSFDEVKSFLSAASINAPTDALVLMLYSGMAQADRRRYIYIYKATVLRAFPTMNGLQSGMSPAMLKGLGRIPHSEGLSTAG